MYVCVRACVSLSWVVRRGGGVEEMLTNFDTRPPIFFSTYVTHAGPQLTSSFFDAVVMETISFMHRVPLKLAILEMISRTNPGEIQASATKAYVKWKTVCACAF